MKRYLQRVGHFLQIELSHPHKVEDAGGVLPVSKTSPCSLKFIHAVRILGRQNSISKPLRVAISRLFSRDCPKLETSDLRSEGFVYGFDMVLHSLVGEHCTSNLKGLAVIAKLEGLWTIVDQLQHDAVDKLFGDGEIHSDCLFREISPYIAGYIRVWRLP